MIESFPTDDPDDPDTPIVVETPLDSRSRRSMMASDNFIDPRLLLVSGHIETGDTVELAQLSTMAR